MKTALLILILFLTPAARASDLTTALATLDQAVALRQSEPARSRVLAADAAALLESALEPADRANPQAQRALANAYLLGGDLGRAVLAYRRAQLADPQNPQTIASLAHARSLIESTPPQQPPKGWKPRLATLAAALPWPTLFWTSLTAATAGFLGLAVVLLHPARRALIAPAAALAACGSVVLIASHTIPPRLTTTDAVLIQPATAHTGPDAAVYPAALDAQVPAGTELRILESRDAWSRVRIGATEAWLPTDRLEPIDQTPTAAGVPARPGLE